MRVYKVIGGFIRWDKFSEESSSEPYCHLVDKRWTGFYKNAVVFVNFIDKCCTHRVTDNTCLSIPAANSFAQVNRLLNSPESWKTNKVTLLQMSYVWTAFLEFKVVLCVLVCWNWRRWSVWLWEAVHLQWRKTKASDPGQPVCGGNTGHRQCPGTTPTNIFMSCSGSY